MKKRTSLLDNIKKFKAVSIIISVIMIVFGVLLFIPQLTKGTIILSVWLLLVLMAVGAMYNIIKYCTTKKEERNGWMLAEGIIMTLLVVLLVVTACVNGKEGIAYTSETLFLWTCVFIGFFTLFGGIYKITTSGSVGNPTLAVIIGILQIVVGCVLSFGFWFCWDKADVYVVICFLAGYMCIMGIISGLTIFITPKEEIKEKVEEIRDFVNNDNDDIN